MLHTKKINENKRNKLKKFGFAAAAVTGLAIAPSIVNAVGQWKYNPQTRAIDYVNEGTSPGGADTEIQFNDGGTFGGDSNLTWDKSTQTFNVNGTNFGVVADGAIQMGGIDVIRLTQTQTGNINNIYIGPNGPAESTARANTVIGDGAGSSLTDGGNDNCLIGLNAGASITTGDQNFCLGTSAGSDYLTATSKNVYIGTSSGRRSGGGNNVAIGTAAGYGAANASNYRCIAIGEESLQAINQADDVTALGFQAGYSVTNGHRNTLLGGYAGWHLTTHTDSVMIGYFAGYEATVSGSIFIGKEAGRAYTTSDNRLMIENSSDITTPLIYGEFDNDYVRVYGDFESDSLRYLAAQTGAADDTTFILGPNSNQGNTASGNTFIGNQAGQDNTSGSNNLCIGTRAGESNVTGGSNVCLGPNAGFANTASNNTFIGASSGNANVAGSANCYIGVATGQIQTGGNGNTYIGSNAGRLQAGSRNSNTFIGREAGADATGTDNSTCIGAYAGERMGTSDESTYIGTQAGRYSAGATNTAIGRDAMLGVNGSTTGVDNVAIGHDTFKAITSGGSNVGIGESVGVSLTSGSNNILIGQGIDVSSATVSDELNIGGLIVGDMTSGSEKLTVNGWLGVGRTPTTFEMEIVGTTPNLLIEDTGSVAGSGAASIRLHNNTQEWGLNVFNSDNFAFTDITSGSVQVFTIAPGAPSEAFKVAINEVKFNASAADYDFVIAKLTTGEALRYNAGANVWSQSASQHRINDGEFRFNYSGGDRDFRIYDTGGWAGGVSAYHYDAGNAEHNFIGDTLITGTHEVTKAIRRSAVETITAASDTLDDSNYFVRCDCTSNNITINLPTAVGNTGLVYRIKKVDSTANTVTIDGNGSETIDGNTTIALALQYDSWTIISNGTNWDIL